MKDYNDWLFDRTGLRCEIRMNIGFHELADTIRAIVSNIPDYIAEATKPADAPQGKYDGLPSQDCHALILRKLDVLRDSLSGRVALLYDVVLFQSICSELVELAKRADEDWSNK